MNSPKLWAIVFSLLATFAVIHIRGDVDRVPPSAPLNQVPETFGAWKSEDVPISAEVLQVLGKGDFLNRIYTRASSSAGAPDSGLRTLNAGTPPVQLFIGYFATQRTGQSIHSPQNCLPGSGWTFLSSGVTDFTDSTGKAYRVGDYVISDGETRQEVLYWYQSHGHSIANDYAAKFHMLLDSIRLGRTDAALVRVITPIAQNESEAHAHARLVSFTKNVTPLLPAYVPN